MNAQTDIIACGPIFDLAGEDVCAWTLITPPGIVATKLRWNTMGWEPFQVQKMNIINYDIGTWCRLAGMRNTAGRCVLGTRVRFKTPTLRYICFAVSYQHLLAIPEPHKNYIPHKKFFLQMMINEEDKCIRAIARTIDTSALMNIHLEAP